MHIYSAADIRKWDEYTIAHEPILAIALMERAALAVAAWLRQRFSSVADTAFCVVCGPGNNGGDGLAIARMLSVDYAVQVVLLPAANYSEFFQQNLAAVKSLSIPVFELLSLTDMPPLPPQTVVVDAIFGTGLNRPPAGIAMELIHAINALPNTVVAIDIPTGMYADTVTPHPHVVAAQYTLSFQCAKLAFMLPEHEQMLGHWQVLNIGLHPGFSIDFPPVFHIVEHPATWVAAKHYSQYTHKGLRGHLLLGAGSATMMGAAVLATRSALRSGAGLVTVATDTGGWPILQTAAPEAICAAGVAIGNANFQQQRRVKAIAVGPGWTAEDEHLQQLVFLWEQAAVPVVADATALSLVKALLHRPVLQTRPVWMLTPHVGEFDAMFGYAGHHAERWHKAITAAAKYNVIIVLKGKYTQIVNPEGQVFFNATGNHGMAKGGSGDVLTGLIGGLLAQGYQPLEACILGTWLHGKAGDVAAEKYGTETMTAQHIVDALPKAFEAWLQGAGITPYENRGAISQ